MWQVDSYSYTGWRGFSDASGAGILRLLGGGHRISRRRDVCRDVYRWNGGSMCLHGKEPKRDASASRACRLHLPFRPSERRSEVLPRHPPERSRPPAASGMRSADSGLESARHYAAAAGNPSRRIPDFGQVHSPSTV